MAKGNTTAARTARQASIMLEAKAALGTAAEVLGEAQAALVNASNTLDPEHLHQIAEAAKSEANRIALAAVMIGGACARLNVVSQLVADEGGAR